MLDGKIPSVTALQL